MGNLRIHLKKIYKAPLSLLFTYSFLYISWGIGMNEFGKAMEIARFQHWWQIITCYLLYMVPISIMLRNFSFFTQYAYGLVAMGILEFMGYWLQTSYVYPDNVLEAYFNPQNFSLGMALFFALYFPVGNWLVRRLHTIIFGKKNEKTAVI